MTRRGRRNYKAEELVRRADGRTFAGRSAWFPTQGQAERWLTVLGVPGDVDLWVEARQEMFACSRRRSDGTFVRRGPRGEWLIDGRELATPLISAFAEPGEHVVTLSNDGGPMTLSCSSGCDLGTSARVAGIGEAMQRADLHRTATSLAVTR